LPLSSFSANLSVSGGSSLSLSIHGAEALLGAIVARASGQLVISRLHVYSDGSTVSREFIRVNYDTLSSDTGPRSGLTVTLRGRKTIKASASKVVNVYDAISRSLSDGVVRYRCAINDDLNLGDTAVINGEQLIIGRIGYSVDARSESMDLSEYQADGNDLPGSIGSNSRPPTLQPYLVTVAHANYTLWRPTAFFYNSIPVNAETASRSFTLYYDSSGLLWYMDGFEDASNVKVFLSDAITQATVNA
jgi:hypothetical protein